MASTDSRDQAWPEDTFIEMADFLCPFLGCVRELPHRHYVCGLCGAVRFGNLFCGHCNANRHKEEQWTPMR